MFKSTSMSAAPRGTKRRRESKEARTTSFFHVLLAILTLDASHHGISQVRQAARKEKAFEIRKLVRKVKSLRTKDVQADEQSISDYISQLEALKRLDHEPLGILALELKLKKDRLLSQNEQMQALINAELLIHVLTLANPGTAARKTQDRILSSKLLAATTKSVLSSLKHIIDPDSVTLPEVKAAAGLGDAPSTQKQLRAAKATGALPDEIGSDSESEGDDDAQEQEWASESSDEGAGDGWESGSIDDAGIRVASHLSASDEHLDSGDEEEDEDVSASALTTNVTKRSEAALRQAKTAGASSDMKGKGKATAQSTFLPSLSVGFIKGDSDASDWSDAEASVAGGVRKNRRGQRARRAIWEKKYGKNANHVKKEREAFTRNPRANTTANRRGPGQPRKDAAPGARARPQPQFTAPPSDKGWSKNKTPAGDTPVDIPPKQKHKEDNSLHPSWEAKRRLKEKLNPNILPPQGKKITF
ncbi:Bud-site selection protein [Laetiporus sulphureus 93-53]|uniref:Bud-site selection protein n=1 Tax=Laetiporus sulphureus 93-53 TaxID=1314785 RepID=A0A165HQB1_9APHY|nr:Bud-site selection protein [Laetiporus sulphureus 93-53]KZT12043.1 Bud-site selection protein [Laetiporus sulphureus 93-53]